MSEYYISECKWSDGIVSWKIRDDAGRTVSEQYDKRRALKLLDRLRHPEKYPEPTVITEARMDV